MSAAARLMTDTAAICSRTLRQPLVPEYMIKDIKLIMAAGIIPALYFLHRIRLFFWRRG